MATTQHTAAKMANHSFTPMIISMPVRPTSTLLVSFCAESYYPKYDMLSLPTGELLLHSQSSSNAPGMEVTHIRILRNHFLSDIPITDEILGSRVNPVVDTVAGSLNKPK